MIIMDVSESIRKRRSIRKFKDERIPYEDLEELVEAARLAPSSANKQPLEYLIVDDPELEEEIFEYTNWAGYLEWEPSKEERPRAYILVLVDEENRTENYKVDAGLAVENICLEAVGKGLGTCILGAIDRDAIKSALNIPENKRVEFAIGIGVPDHTAMFEEAERDEIEYWMDEDGDFHVPKRRLEDILYWNEF